MQEKAKVIAIDKDIVSVVPLDIEICMGCSNTECKTNGNVFTVANRRKLDIRVGSEVRVNAPVKNQLSQAFFAIGIPVLLAVLVWQIVPILFFGATEVFQVGGALLALFAGAVIMFLLTHRGSKDLPEITEVL